MNEKQIEHSRLYPEYARMQDLRATAAAKSTGEVEVLRGAGQKVFFPNTRPIQLADFVAAMTRRADAIVIGVVNDQKSFLTAEGTFVFTDYNLTVESVLKNNPTAAIVPSDSIIVTRPGGTAQLRGRNIRASDESLAPFEVGHRYLLFLGYIPATGAYKASNSSGAFRIAGNKTSKLTKEQLPSELENGAGLAVLMAYIQTALH